MSVNTTNTVKEIAVTVPGATRIFEQIGIDYCCGGGHTLKEACDKSRLSVDEVVKRLESAEQVLSPGDKVPDWQSQSLTSLAAHIVDTHHFFTKQELVRLEKLLGKVCSRHGEKHPELMDLRKIFLRLNDELIPHMLKEEQALFPHIARMEEAVSEGRAVPPPFFVTVQNPVRMMTTEHEMAGVLLGEMRRITNDFSAPADACVRYQTLYQALPAFEADLHQHIHLENNILFPRAVEMETSLGPDWNAAVRGFGEHRCFHQ
jgi:regulator of cell morphogenesis and NO signaling